MAGERFTTKYWRRMSGGRLALLVSDAAGTLYIFTGDAPRPYLAAPTRRASQAALLRDRGWHRVTVVASYSLGGLRRLLHPQP